MTRKELELAMDSIERLKRELADLESTVKNAKLEPWVPKRGGTYYYINTTGSVSSSTYGTSDYCKHNEAIGNVHESPEAAKDWERRRFASIRLFSLARESWKNSEEEKLGWYIVCKFNRLDIIQSTRKSSSFNPHFRTKESAANAAATIGHQCLMDLFEKGL